jgi:hypothetical protein
MTKKPTDISDIAFSMFNETSGKVSKDVKDSIRDMNPSGFSSGNFGGLKGGKVKPGKTPSFKHSGITNKAALPRGAKNK